MALAMKHKYECGNGKCGYVFVADESYENDPCLRNCPKCKKAKGNVLYHGSGKSSLGLVRDDLGMAGVKNPVDGKTYDSKSAYHRRIKDAGCHVIESGNVSKREQGDHNVKKELRQAIDQFLPNRRTRK